MAEKLSELMGPSPSVPEEGVTPEEPNEQRREDQLQAFTDFTNDALPMQERMDALAFFVELVQDVGPTLFPDED